MKTMTCSMLGGPTDCNHELHADTFDAMIEESQKHGMEMKEKGDEAHIAVMEKMSKIMEDPEAMKEWDIKMEEMKVQFDALPEDS